MSEATRTEGTPTNITRNRILILGGAAALLLLPMYIFRYKTGAMTYYLGSEYPPGQAAYIMMRPAGHIAFTLIFFQILLGQNVRRFARWLGVRSLVKVHMTLGLSAFAFALLHPILFMWAKSLRAGALTWKTVFFPTPNDYYHTHLFFGALALYGLTVGVIAGAYGPRLAPRIWRAVHGINYLVFLSAWYHGFFIGSETRYQPLAVLYTVMVVIVAVLMVRRVLTGRGILPGPRPAEA